MLEQREASLFRNGRSQAVRIPRDFELPGDRVTITKSEGRLIIEAKVRRRSLAEILDSLEPINDEPWPEIEDLPPEPVEI